MGENSIKLNICYGCMRQLADGQFVCPTCEYDNSHRSNSEDVLPEGSILNGKYLVGKVLGRGGFGVTYLGFDLNLQIRVAIKEYFPRDASLRAKGSYDVISLSNTETSSAFSKGCNIFLDEAQTLAKFNSPYIVHVREFFREHGTAYIIMDYVDGVTITETINGKRGKMSSDQVFSLMKPLIQQLGKLHERNIIHRDIKPDNIMIVKEDTTGDEHLVLLDFGAARSFVSENVTKTYTAIVTPGFAPIEQYSEESRQGPYTDVYGLSATMYYMLTGKVPTDVNAQVNGIPIKPFHEYGITIPRHVEKAIMHGLALKSGDRTQTMQQLSEELSEEQIEEYAHKKPPTILILICILAAVLVGIAGNSTLSGDSSSPKALYKKAASLMKKGQYAEAESIFEDLEDYEESKTKLAEARYYLGLSYQEGDGVEKNDNLAVSYYQMAADAGNGDAMNKLGECVYHGVGRTQNYNTAFEYFEKAADLGSVDALYNLGLCYETGNGIKKDNELAKAYYSIAAENGNKSALEKLNG